LPKSKRTSSAATKWPEEIAKEARRDLPQSTIDSYLRLLEEKGLVGQQSGFANPTDSFRELFAKSIVSLRKWYRPSPIDDPQGLLALEMARLILKVSPAEIKRGSADPKKLGQLSSVIAGLLRHYFKEDESKKLMALILGIDAQPS
jgi:hypothetical protein